MINPYHLAFPGRFGLDLSVLSFTLDEALDVPYRLTVAVTCLDADLPLATLIDQPVAFTVQPVALAAGIPGLELPGAGLAARAWHGVVRSATRGRSTAEETLYTFDIAPRLARLGDGKTTRLFQNQTIPQVIETVLRQHDFSGSDFSFSLSHEQPSFEHLTQYR